MESKNALDKIMGKVLPTAEKKSWEETVDVTWTATLTYERGSAPGGSGGTVDAGWVAGGRREFLKPSRPPRIVRGADRTESTEDTIYLGRGLNKSQEDSFLKHEMLHITFFDYEDRWQSLGAIKNLGNTKIDKMHPRFKQYTDREKSSEDFVTSAGEWIDGKRFAGDIERGWITREEADSRMKFFDDIAKHKPVTEGSSSSGNCGGKRDDKERR